MNQADHLADGARNLLENCVGQIAGKRVLIVHETPELGWYDLTAPLAVKREAENLGAAAALLAVGAPSNQANALVADAIAYHDVIVFFARLGDQDRFADPIPGKVCVMSYARTAEALSSDYGRADHGAFVDLKDAIDRTLQYAETIRITCALGTDLTGKGSRTTGHAAGDVRFHRFPLGVPTPVSAASFSGRVAIASYLTPTGSKVYDPPFVRLTGTVFAELNKGRIVELSGEPEDVDRVRSHYQAIADRFDIDRDFVHSWHAGIHPGCSYDQLVAEDPDRWSNNVFTHPRYLHFHTCGAYAPGEICWMVLDPTVIADGLALWQDGRLCVENVPRLQGCLQRWPLLADLFSRDPGNIGRFDDIDPEAQAVASTGR